MRLAEATEKKLGQFLTEQLARVLGTIFDQEGIARPGHFAGYLAQDGPNGREYKFPAGVLNETLTKYAGRRVRVQIVVDVLEEEGHALLTPEQVQAVWHQAEDDRRDREEGRATGLAAWDERKNRQRPGYQEDAPVPLED